MDSQVRAITIDPFTIPIEERIAAKPDADNRSIRLGWILALAHRFAIERKQGSAEFQIKAVIQTEPSL